MKKLSRIALSLLTGLAVATAGSVVPAQAVTVGGTVDQCSIAFADGEREKYNELWKEASYTRPSAEDIIRILEVSDKMRLTTLANDLLAGGDSTPLKTFLVEEGYHEYTAERIVGDFKMTLESAPDTSSTPIDLGFLSKEPIQTPKWEDLQTSGLYFDNEAKKHLPRSASQ